MMEDKEMYRRIDGCMSFEDCQDEIAFLARSIKKARYDTYFLKVRIRSIHSLTELLLRYEEKAEIQKEEAFFKTNGGTDGK